MKTKKRASISNSLNCNYFSLSSQMTRYILTSYVICLCFVSAMGMDKCQYRSGSFNMDGMSGSLVSVQCVTKDSKDIYLQLADSLTQDPNQKHSDGFTDSKIYRISSDISEEGIKSWIKDMKVDPRANHYMKEHEGHSFTLIASLWSGNFQIRCGSDTLTNARNNGPPVSTLFTVQPSEQPQEALFQQFGAKTGKQVFQKGKVAFVMFTDFVHNGQKYPTTLTKEKLAKCDADGTLEFSFLAGDATTGGFKFVDQTGKSLKDTPATKVTKQSISCEASKATTVSTNYKLLMTDLETAKTNREFKAAAASLNVLTNSETYAALACTIDPNDPAKKAEFNKDPCCSKIAAWTQCCVREEKVGVHTDTCSVGVGGEPGKDDCVLSDTATAIAKKEKTEPGGCGADYEKAKSFIQYYGKQMYLKNIPGDMNCDSEVEQNASEDDIDAARKFVNECQSAVYHGKTKANLDDCTTSSDCYSGVCSDNHSKKQCTQMSGSAAAKALFKCWVQNAPHGTEKDPGVWDYVADDLGFSSKIVNSSGLLAGLYDVPTSKSLVCPSDLTKATELIKKPSDYYYCAEQKWMKKVTMKNCVGSGYMHEQGVCMIDLKTGPLTEEQCKALEAMNGITVTSLYDDKNKKSYCKVGQNHFGDSAQNRLDSEMIVSCDTAVKKLSFCVPTAKKAKNGETYVNHAKVDCQKDPDYKWVDVNKSVGTFHRLKSGYAYTSNGHVWQEANLSLCELEKNCNWRDNGVTPTTKDECFKKEGVTDVNGDNFFCGQYCGGGNCEQDMDLEQCVIDRCYWKRNRGCTCSENGHNAWTKVETETLTTKATLMSRHGRNICGRPDKKNLQKCLPSEVCPKPRRNTTYPPTCVKACFKDASSKFPGYFHHIETDSKAYCEHIKKCDTSTCDTKTKQQLNQWVVKCEPNESILPVDHNENRDHHQCREPMCFFPDKNDNDKCHSLKTANNTIPMFSGLYFYSNYASGAGLCLVFRSHSKTVVNKANCEKNSGQWWEGRTHYKGYNDSKQACEEGLCYRRNQGRDYNAKCLGEDSGSCNRHCSACHNNYTSYNAKKSLCVVDKSQNDCTSKYEWNDTEKVCLLRDFDFNDEQGEAVCKKEAATFYSCSTLSGKDSKSDRGKCEVSCEVKSARDYTSCQAAKGDFDWWTQTCFLRNMTSAPTSDQDCINEHKDAVLSMHTLSVTEAKMSRLMQCKFYRHSSCKTEAECTQQGECTDWDVRGGKCILPYEPDETGRRKSCRDIFLNGDHDKAYDYAHKFGCHAPVYKKGECEAMKNHKWIKEANDKVSCDAHGGTCGSKHNDWTETGLSKADCENTSKCSDKKWYPRAQWYPGKWTTAGEVRRGQWMKREYTSKYVVDDDIDRRKMDALIDDGIAVVFNEMYKRQIQCHTAPNVAAISVVANACGVGSDKVQEQKGVVNVVLKSKTVLCESIASSGFELANASVRISCPGGCTTKSCSSGDKTRVVENLELGLGLYNTKPLSTRRRLMPSEYQACEKWANVPNAKGHIIGQTLNDSFVKTEVEGASTLLCRKVDVPDKEVCTKFDTLDVAQSTESGVIGVPIKTTITTKDGLLCATGLSAGRWIFVKRQSDMEVGLPPKSPDCKAVDGFPTTEAGKTASIACPSGQSGAITRECDTDGNWLLQKTSCTSPPTPTPNDKTPTPNDKTKDGDVTVKDDTSKGGEKELKPNAKATFSADITLKYNMEYDASVNAAKLKSEIVTAVESGGLLSVKNGTNGVKIYDGSLKVDMTVQMTANESEKNELQLMGKEMEALTKDRLLSAKVNNGLVPTVTAENVHAMALGSSGASSKELASFLSITFCILMFIL